MMMNRPQRTGRASGASGLWIGLALVAVAASGCQPAAVGIEEAKKITAEFQGPRFSLPPRDIDDVVDLLRQSTPAEEAEMARLGEWLEAAPPASQEGVARVRFLVAQADAATRLGRARRAIEIWRTVTELAGANPAFDTIERGSWRFNLAEAYGAGGDPAVAIREGLEAIAILRKPPEGDPLFDGNRFGRAASFQNAAAMFYASVGDLDAAEAAIARSERDRRKFEAVVVLARAHDVVLDEETLVGVGLTRALILQVGGARLAVCAATSRTPRPSCARP